MAINFLNVTNTLPEIQIDDTDNNPKLTFKESGTVSGGVSTTGGDLVFEASSGTERARILSGGNFGIGTASPAQKLEVNGAVLAGDYRGSAQIYLTSPDSWIFRSTGGSERMKITSAGNVGIGTSSPGYKLTVEGAVAVQNAQNLWIRGGRVGYENTALDNAAYIYNIGAAGSSKLNIADTLYVVEAGNVGIGTTSPAAQFNVQGTSTIGWSNLANARILAGSVTAGIGIDSNEIVSKGENLYIGTITSGTDIVMRAGGATSRLQISGTNGNVGIGTTTPTAKLHVAGTGLFTGLVSGITPVAAANFVTKAYVDGSGGGTGGPFLPLAGGTMTGDLNLTYAYPRINLTDTNHNSDYSIINNDGTFSIYDITNNSHRLSISAAGNATFAGSLTIPEYIIHAGDTDTKFGFAGVNDYRVHIGGSDRFRITGDVHVKGATDFAIPAGRKLYLDGQSNTYITESSADNIKFFTGGSEALLLNSSQNATFAGNVLLGDDKNLDFGSATDFRIVHNSTTNVNHISSKLDRQLSINANIINLTNQANTANYLVLNSTSATFAGTIDSGTITSTGIVKTSTTFQSTNGSMLFFVPNVGQALEIAQNTGNATFAGNVSMPTGNSTGKFAVMSTAVHGSYDFYNNGTSYLNGTVIVDAAFSQTGGLASTFSGTVTIPEQIYHTGDTNTYFGFSANDTWRVVTGGSQRLDITNSGTRIGGGARVTTILDEDNMASDSATALATQQSIKAYVDNSISGGANYLGVWDPDDSLNNGYGNPSLQASTRTDDSGDYFICSADGAAHPNGGTTEPDSWHVGDWVIWNEDLGSSGLWQKIDNTTVLSGGGTANKVAKFTDSETIGDGPITFSSNDSSFTGDVLPLTNGGSNLGSNSKQYGSIYAGGIAASTVTLSTIKLNGSFNTLNKAQNAYIGFATRNTSGSEAVMDITNAGSGTFAGDVTAPSFIGKLMGGATGAPDATIWCVSGDYTNWGIFYDESTPDLIQFKSSGNVKATISLDHGDYTGRNATFTGDIATSSGKLNITSDGSAANGAEIYLKHANNNTTDTIGTIIFGNNADSTLSTIVSETNGANNTSNLKFTTSNAGTIGTVLTLNGDNTATFGALTSGQTAQLIVNQEGGVAPVAKFLSRTNKAIVQISDNDTTGYVSSENGFFSLGRASGVNAANINIDANSRIGIGTTTIQGNTKVNISGAMLQDGKTSWLDSSGSALTTTGRVVAGLVGFSGGNGASALYMFTCYGGGGYQRIVYSIINVGGTWQCHKDIDEGQNALDVVASTPTSGSAVTFTFKGRSTSQGYTASVWIEHIGSSIDTQYIG